MVEDWVKKLSEDLLGGPSVAIGKKYQHPEDGEILITSGQYWGIHGLSNFWYWTIIETGESRCGYGQPWPEVN